MVGPENIQPVLGFKSGKRLVRGMIEFWGGNSGSFVVFKPFFFGAGSAGNYKFLDSSAAMRRIGEIVDISGAILRDSGDIE